MYSNRQLALLAACAGAAVSIKAAPLESRQQSNATLYPHDIQGPGYTSPLAGQVVADVRGVVTFVASNGCYIQTPRANWDRDDRTSEGLFVFTGSAAARCGGAVAGDLVSFNGSVSEFARSRTNLRSTQLERITAATVLQRNVTLDPLVIGKERSPPTQYIGVRNPFELPSNTSNLETGPRAASLDPSTFGSDFWESIESMLVTFRAPTVVAPVSSFNTSYVVPGGIIVTSRNARGGLTFASNESPDDNLKWDSNPEAIELGVPLDGTSLDKSQVIGDQLEDITGVIFYDFSNPLFLPLTSPKILRKVTGTAQPTTLTSNGAPRVLTVGAYNVENLSVRDVARVTAVGNEIDNFLRTPDVVVLNEIQDDDGETNSGNVSSNQTLAAIIASIKKAPYQFAYISPVNNQDGGAPGGNIRTAFIYRTDRVRLVQGIPAGNATQAVSATRAASGQAVIDLNPGRIAPNDGAWQASRKPLVGLFEQLQGGARFFVIGAHFTSKGGSTGPYAPSQPPTNGGVAQRVSQAQQVRIFVEQILAAQPTAAVIFTGDLNEFSDVQPLVELSRGNTLREARLLNRTERYSYVFEQNCQSLDHLYVAGRILGAELQIPHINTWTTDAARTSDHDPLVARVLI